jgi:hypothetical protein
MQWLIPDWCFIQGFLQAANTHLKCSAAAIIFFNEARHGPSSRMQSSAHFSPASAGYSRIVKRASLCVIAFFLTIAIILAWNWPFTQTELIRDLEHFSSSEVKVQHFRPTYFPHPGYIADGLVFLRRSNGRPIEISSVKRLECIASWFPVLFLQHRVKDLRVIGLHVLIPAPVPAPMPFYPQMKNRTTITRLTADGTVLDISPRHPGGRSFRFQFQKLVLGGVKGDKSISLDTTLQLPTPPGVLTVRGRFGPMTGGHIGDTPLGGSYELKHADLGDSNAIGGKLYSNGSFRGTLAKCEVTGKVDVDGFEVRSVGHTVKLSGNFDTGVNGIKGDVAINSTRVRFLQTELQASGVVDKRGHQDGKTESVKIIGEKARIEDLLWLFTTSNPPALRGPIGLEADVVVPPGPQEFLRKLQLNGSFKIPAAQFLHTDTRKSVTKLSRRARGEKSKDNENAAENIPASFGARVALQNGLASLTDADFKTLGANASGYGTYNLLTKQIDLRGRLAMEASLSKAAGGIKSVLLIPLDPFFKKGNAGAVLPIHVTGTYSHPSFHVSLTGHK